MLKVGFMEGQAHPFKGRLGLQQVFAAGFSLGGCTVVSSVIAITDTRNFVAWVARQPTAAPGPPRVSRPQQPHRAAPRAQPRVPSLVETAVAPRLLPFVASRPRA